MFTGEVSGSSELRVIGASDGTGEGSADHAGHRPPQGQEWGWRGPTSSGLEDEGQALALTPISEVWGREQLLMYTGEERPLPGRKVQAGARVCGMAGLAGVPVSPSRAPPAGAMTTQMSTLEAVCA